MSTHNISRRIQSIIQFIYDFNYPSKTEMIEFLEEKDFKVSARTLERDIDRIRSDFGLEIIYSKANNGYYIDKNKSVKVESFFRFLEIVSIANIFSESLQNSNKIMDYVSFDDSKNFIGIDSLKEVLLAINQKRILHFTHENFEENTFKNYTINPILLKEYENRWYVIGVPNKIDEIRTFGIDRITDLKLGEISNANQSKFKNQLNNFNNVIGLFFSDEDPVNVRLLVDNPHIKYMKTLPLHHSQIIHSKNEKGQCFVDFVLIPNYEFKTQILKMGSEVEVIFPENLRLEIKSTLKRTLSKYL